MKLYRSDKLVRDINVAGSLTGCRVDEVRLNHKDLVNLHEMSNSIKGWLNIKAWIDKLVTRFPPESIDLEKVTKEVTLSEENKIIRYIEYLTSEEMSSVTIYNPNPDFDCDGHHYAIDVIGDWTGQNPARYYGETLSETLHTACITCRRLKGIKL